MNILLTTETYLPYITGVSISTDSIARYMVSRGHKVTLVCPQPIVKGDVEPMTGLTIIRVPSGAAPFYNFNVTAHPFAASRVLESLFEENKFDVVHVQEPGVLGVTALKKAKKYKVPVNGALHFIPEQIDRVLWGSFERVLTPVINVYMKYIYNKYDSIMTPSHFFASYLKKLGVKKPINVVSNGTNTKKFHPGSLDKNLRKKLGIDENDFVFFFLGRLDRDKNVETLVRAIPFTDKKVKLLIVGKGTERPFLKNLARMTKVSEKIIWVDYITDSEMPDYYHAVNAFSIMSPYEGQSIVTLQAAATGLPIIAADASALPELCHDHKNGFLVDTYDYKTLAARMDELVHNQKMSKEFGEDSRRIALLHDKPKVLHRLEVIFDKLGRHMSPVLPENIS